MHYAFIALHVEILFERNVGECKVIIKRSKMYEVLVAVERAFSKLRQSFTGKT